MTPSLFSAGLLPSTLTSYEQGTHDLSQISLETDNVFSDGVGEQMATVTGGVEEGFAASLAFGVDVWAFGTTVVLQPAPRSWRKPGASNRSSAKRALTFALSQA